MVYYFCPCLGNNSGTLQNCYLLFVLQNCTFFHFEAVGQLVKVWLFMRADREPGAGCECWSKAGWTNVCTHTSIVLLAACRDVKHNDVVRGCRRATRSLLRSHDTQRHTEWHQFKQEHSQKATLKKQHTYWLSSGCQPPRPLSSIDTRTHTEGV